jgi:hypothetical protein
MVLTRGKLVVALTPFGIVVAAVALLSGCGTSGPTRVPVSGTVLVDGKPVEGIEVNFATAEVAGSGVTDPSGKFMLSGGAAPGMNKVWLRKFVGGDPALLEMDAEQLAAMSAAGSGAKIPKSLLPPKYSDSAATMLTFDVPQGGTADAKIEASAK